MSEERIVGPKVKQYVTLEDGRVQEIQVQAKVGQATGRATPPPKAQQSAAAPANGE